MESIEEKVESVKVKEENFIDFERQRRERKKIEGKNPFLEREKSIEIHKQGKADYRKNSVLDTIV